MKLIVAGSVRYETTNIQWLASDVPSNLMPGNAYLSSGPPSLRTIFLREKMVPNINFASSSALKAFG